MTFRDMAWLYLCATGALTACGSDVERVLQPDSTQSAANASASTSTSSAASSGTTPGSTSTLTGGLIYRIAFSPKPTGSVDIYGRSCLSASGTLTNTLTGENFYHLNGSALTPTDQVLQVTATMEIATGRVSGSFSSTQAFIVGSFSGLADGDVTLRTWNTTGGCVGTWSLTRDRSALDARGPSAPASDVHRASAWRLNAAASSDPGTDGAACGPLEGQIGIDNGELWGVLRDASGQSLTVSTTIDASGAIEPTTVASAANSTLLDGAFSALVGQGTLTTGDGCRSAWTAERLLQP